MNLIADLYNAFEPLLPLEAGDPAYVDCQEVRGDWNVLEDLGQKIILSPQPTCRLYTGHRGVGKSTELLRLQDYLRGKGYFVVYFPADKADIEPEDTEYSDILLACTRHVLEALKDHANPSPLLNWLKSRWQSLKDLAMTELSFESLEVEGQISQFAKLTANLRAVPNLRQEIRKQVDAHTVSLVEALNKFIEEAQTQLPYGCSQIVVMADNLDRITPITQENGRNNYDEIFLDRSEQLKALKCHVIYTVPISMVYSRRCTLLEDSYGKPQVLPMIMVRDTKNSTHALGVAKMKELIAKRVETVNSNLSKFLEPKVFDSIDTLERVCLMSGGHVRNLMSLMQTAIERTPKLPIPAKALQRAITEARDTYRNTVEEDQWITLANVSRFKRIPNDDQHRGLLLNRCLLEYRYLDTEGEIKRWYDVHPLIKGIEQFQEAQSKIEEA
jgi:hypothetical protein